MALTQENTIYRTYNKWIPELSPTKECKKNWENFINFDNSSLYLDLPSSEIPGETPFLINITPFIQKN